MPGVETPEIIRPDLPTYLTFNIMRIVAHRSSTRNPACGPIPAGAAALKHIW